MADGRGAHLCAWCGTQGDFHIDWRGMFFCSQPCRDQYAIDYVEFLYGDIDPERELPRE